MKYNIVLIFLIIIVILPIYATQEIPSWVKNNAKWWSEDQINDSTFVKGIEYLIKIGVIEVNKNQDIEQFKKIDAKISEFFRVWVYENDIYLENNVPVARNFHFELINELGGLYDEIGIINEDVNVIVILPVFTSSAYSKNGFYDFYAGKCEKCITVKIVEQNFLRYFEASQVGARVLEVLGYKTITDIDLDKNPDIIKKFNTVILLHNEYVTQKEFDAITSHSNVIYLYPNALYVKIDVNYKNNTITLIRGHGYPEQNIDNGFNWKYDNTRPYEFDEICSNWEFYEIPNGKMLNCYPEKLFLSDKEFLKTIKKLVN